MTDHLFEQFLGRLADKAGPLYKRMAANPAVRRQKPETTPRPKRPLVLCEHGLRKWPSTYFRGGYCKPCHKEYMDVVNSKRKPRQKAELSATLKSTYRPKP